MKRIVTIIMVLLLVSIIYLNTVSAYNLELELSADKKDVKVGDEVTVTLNISKGMQAADFTINYDSNLLKFKSGSLGSNFYNANTPGKVVCSWFDTNDKNTFTFTFIAISSGVAEFSTTTENFYDGNLQSASSYNEGMLNVTLLSSNGSSNGTVPLQDNPNTQQPTDITSKQDTVKEPIKQTNTETEVNKETKPVTTTQPTITKEKSQELVNTSKTTQKPTAKEEKKTTTSTTQNTLPQTGSNSSLFILIFISIIAVAIISKMKLNKLRDI